MVEATAGTPLSGLGEAEARARLQRHGPNELPRPPRRTLPRIALGVLTEPMFLLLVVAGAIYLAIGDLESGLLLGTFALLTIALVSWQHARSERALDALRQLAAPMARVLRDGSERRIAAREVVPGDLLLVGEGERIAADARLLRADDLRTDESLLTGESVPVARQAPAQGAGADADAEAADRIYAGTLVVAGHGVAEVVATGMATETGRIGASLASIEPGGTPLQRSVARLVRLFAAGALVACAGVVVLYGLRNGDWLQGVLSGIALAMALLPEEFPVALAVFLAIGAWRLAQVKVLTRQPAAVEALGATSVLCVDKTGTLTENRMRVRALSSGGNTVWVERGQQTLPEPVHRVLELAVLASKRRAFDPMDSALQGLGGRALAGTGHLHAEWPLEREYGFTPGLPAVSRVWRTDAGGFVVATKGAPEAVAELCGLDAEQWAAIDPEVASMAAHGLRVLGVAAAEVAEGPLPEDPRRLPFRWVGLVAFADPLRSNAASAVAEARAAGIEVVMITGDYPATALAIAAEAGIDTAAGALTGPELAELDDAALDATVRRVRVYARIRPEQKLRLVRALRAQGEVVAMTGDGVNDAPALKAAHIGLAMGGRGTDVAREAAAIVLLDDDIGNLVAGVRLGRRIFENLRKVLIYIAAIHVPIAGLALLPLAMGLPPLLLPMHVVLIEMVIDPICSIAFESEPAEADIMRRPPRDPAQALAGLPQLALAMLQGSLLLAACMGAYLFALRGGEDMARTLAVVALTAGNLMLVRVDGARGATLPRLFERGHRAFWVVAVLATAVIALCILVPPLAQVFRFAAPPLPWVALAVLAGVGSALAFDLLKPLPRVRAVLAPAARDRQPGAD